MNETGLIHEEQGDSVDRITQRRWEDDDSLVAEVARYNIVRTWRSVALDNFIAVGGLYAAAWLMGAFFPRFATALVLIGPLLVASYFVVRGMMLGGRAAKHWRMVPLWERHRINVILARVAKKEQTL